MLVGRKKERDTLAALVDGAKRGHGGVLVVTGEPGIGKTTLLDDAIERAGAGVTVLRGSGIESDQDLPFACLADVLRPAEREFRVLPHPQSRALRRAVGLEQGDEAVDRL